MPPLLLVAGAFPGKLKKQPGAGPLGHIAGLMNELLGNILKRVLGCGEVLSNTAF